MIGIYRIINPKGKIYIGQSIQIEIRWKQYGDLEKQSLGTKIFNSIKKYGVLNHKFEMIEECKIEELDNKEIYYKQQFIEELGWDEALFCEIYDKGGGPKSEETKNKQSKTHQTHLTKPEILEKRKINCKLAANKPGVQEKSFNNTDWESRNKNFRKSVGRIILQKDLKGNLIKEWECSWDIQKELKFWSTEITKHCKHHPNKPYKGFIWNYKFPNEIKRKSCQVIQFDLNNNFIKEFNSPSQAAKSLGLSASNLYRCLKGEYKTFGGFIWKYK